MTFESLFKNSTGTARFNRQRLLFHSFGASAWNAREADPVLTLGCMVSTFALDKCGVLTEG